MTEAVTLSAPPSDPPQQQAIHAAPTPEAARLQGPWVTPSDALGFHILNLQHVQNGVGCVGMDGSVNGSRVASVDAPSGTVRIWVHPERASEPAPALPATASCPAAFTASRPGDEGPPPSLPAILECARDGSDLVCHRDAETARFRSLPGQLNLGAASLLRTDWWDLAQPVHALHACLRTCTAPSASFSLQTSGGTLFGTVANVLRYLAANPGAYIEAGGRLRFLAPDQRQHD
ncbi:MAG: hypothetical protein AB8I08_16305 [Sandaracinaceae bacterium]